MTTLEQLSEQYGIGHAYHDYRGELKVFSTETRLALLAAMGVDPAANAVGPGAATAHRAGMADGLPRVLVVTQGEPVILNLPRARLAGGVLSWTLEAEGGATDVGTINTGALLQSAITGVTRTSRLGRCRRTAYRVSATTACRFASARGPWVP